MTLSFTSPKNSTFGAHAQLSLFAAVQDIYTRAAENGHGRLRNAELYELLVAKGELTAEEVKQKTGVGEDGARHCLATRKVRWLQQTLKSMGMLERVEGLRGQWRATGKGKNALTMAPPGVAMLALDTKWGFAVWADCREFFKTINEPIHLVLTSPPYPLAQARNYGGPSESEYVSFIVRSLEPIMRNLVDGGSVCLNVSNDIFEKGLPSRSLYRERLVLALNSALGLSKMDEIIWQSNKPPGPYQWASKSRVQLNVAWEPVYWFTNNPKACRSNNQRILQPHSDKQKKLIARGGESRSGVWSDGAYRLYPGSYSNPTEGAIQKNVFNIGNACPDQRQLRKYQLANGLPTHGASMPLELASRLVKFLTEKGDLVADLWGGSLTTGKAAEINERRWICTDRVLEYLVGARGRFETGEQSVESMLVAA